MKFPKINKNSKLIILESDGVEIVRDVFGQQYERKRIKETIAEAEVNLGSLTNPNKKIISFKYDVPKTKGSAIGR